MYPSRSSSYFLNTSVMRLRLMHACTNRSKLMLLSPRRSYVLYRSWTNCGESRYPNATSASVNSRYEMEPERSASKRSKRLRQAERKPQRPLGARGLAGMSA